MCSEAPKASLRAEAAVTDDDEDIAPRPLLRPRLPELPAAPDHPAFPPPDPSRRSRSSLPPPSSPMLASRRGLHVIGVAAMGVAAVGFFSGIADERKDVHSGEGEEVVATAPAPGYADLRIIRRGPNAAIYAGAFERFAARVPGVLAQVPPQTDAQRAEVLADRSQRRAYDGAPPTIPHAIDGKSTFECLACHASGGVVAGRRAPAMSHERHDSCTQCHVARSGPPSPPAAPLTSSTFVGQSPTPKGSRAWTGAPPTIPHSTWMRTNCGSCHGVGGALGMRSTHPWRESCQQCHVPSASLNQRASLLPPVGAPRKGMEGP